MDSYLNIKTSRGCKYKDCTVKRPNFNYKGEIIPLFCKKHALDDMVDVRSKLCNHAECDRRATFGNISDNIKVFCSKHKQDGMIDFNNNKPIYPVVKCKAYNCSITPYYNYKDKNKGVLCVNHKESDMVDVVNNYKRKDYKITSIEQRIRIIFDINGLMYITNDTTIYYTLYKYEDKPANSFLFDCVTHYLIVEIVNQQNDNDTSAEILRMKEIRQRKDGLPVWFIRFNPNDYKKINGRKRTSGESQSKRHVKLLEWIKYCQNTSPCEYNDYIRTVYLYYDNWDGHGIERRIEPIQ